MDTRGVPPAGVVENVNIHDDSIPRTSLIDQQPQGQLSLDSDSIPAAAVSAHGTSCTINDDAIARHCSPCLEGTHSHFLDSNDNNNNNNNNNSNDNDGQEQQQEQEHDPNHGQAHFASKDSLGHNTMTTANPPLPYNRTRTLSLQSQTQSVRSFRLEAGSVHEDQRAECNLHDDHGPSAFEEEEAALEYAATLAAARKPALGTSGSTSKISKITARTLSNLGLSSDLPRRSTLAGGEEEEDQDRVVVEHTVEEEEEDHCLSGLCIPQSHFFLTSIMCSNTMTRDGLANERTFLSWLGLCMALCLVSFTFISKSFTLDNLVDNIQQPDHPTGHKDKLSLGIGYTCFLAAFLASIYSLLKYLRNIRRISTRYPFAQAGKWTFTIGMILGTLIMVVLVLAYTTDM